MCLVPRALRRILTRKGPRGLTNNFQSKQPKPAASSNPLSFPHHNINATQSKCNVPHKQYSLLNTNSLLNKQVDDLERDIFGGSDSELSDEEEEG